MSNVSTKYSTTASQNVKLGNLSLKENETRYRDINDLFRQIMADARGESNEVRALIESARNAASSASASATTARGEINEVNARVNTFQTQINSAITTAEAAENSAEAAATSANNAASSAASAAASLSSLQTTVSGLQNTSTSLSNRLTTLEQATAENSGVSLVDDTTIEYLEGDLTAVDIAINEDKTDLASGRGQIGRTAVKTSTQEEPIDLGDIVLDGWYAIGGVGATGLPTGVTSGILRVSSAYAEGSIVQCLWTGSSDACRAFIRWSNGTNWTDWLEQMLVSSLGNGLILDSGVVSVDFSDVLPEATADDSGKVLSADGAWVERATPEQLDEIAESMSELAESISSLRTDLEAVQAEAAVPIDGETIVETDGTRSVPLYFGATSEEDGVAGLVPPASAGEDGLFLRGDGTWADPALETIDFNGETSGLVPAPQEEETGFLRSDGTWADPIENLAPRVDALEELVPVDLLTRLSDVEIAISTSNALQEHPQDFDWRTTSRASFVSCWPVDGTDLEPTVWFAYTETLPEGTKGPENPSMIAGVSSVTVTVGASANDANATSHEAEFGDTYYGGYIELASGTITVTHVAVVPDDTTIDISEYPADTTQFEYVDTFGRTVTTTDGNDLVISGVDVGGTIVYKLATPQTMHVAGTQCPSLAWTNKFTPKQNFLSSTGTEMQCVYAKSIAKTIAEIEARLTALES